MTATLIAILSLAVLGIPIVLAVDRSARGPLLVGTAFLYGSGTMYFVLLTLSIAHIRWTLISVTVASLIVFCAAALIARRQNGPVARPNTTPHVLDLVTIFTIVCYALYATLAPVWEWDFWAIWGLKARTFLEIGGIDWHFLESHWNTFAHPDYPLLVPLNYDFVALLNGGWSDRWLGLICVAWAVALALVVRSLAARETTPFFAALLTTVIAALGFSRYVGLAEGALIAFGGAGVLFVRAALLDGDDVAWRHAALMLGFAANCKNEGLALLVAVTIAVVATSRPRSLKLIPAYALAAPWLILRALHTLPTDIVEGSTISRLLARLPYAHQILLFLAEQLTKPWFWTAILIGILVAPAVLRYRERFIFLVTAIQGLFFVVVYFITPNGLRWHVQSSWPRLTAQLAVPITFAVFLMLANSLLPEEDAAHAEAGFDEY
ncbi:MAG: hypothetical protein WB973_17825 [Thermoanaerobaculia bacterium]